MNMKETFPQRNTAVLPGNRNREDQNIEHLNKTEPYSNGKKKSVPRFSITGRFHREYNEYKAITWNPSFKLFNRSCRSITPSQVCYAGRLVTNTTFCFSEAIFLVYYKALVLSVSPSITDFRASSWQSWNMITSLASRQPNVQLLLLWLTTCKGRDFYVCVSVFKAQENLIG